MVNIDSEKGHFYLFLIYFSINFNERIRFELMSLKVILRKYLFSSSISVKTFARHN